VKDSFLHGSNGRLACLAAEGAEEERVAAQRQVSAACDSAASESSLLLGLCLRLTPCCRTPKDGRPANRTVVFRGFLGETETLTFVTDARSSKVQEVDHDDRAEACLYLPITREQFRVSGRLQVVGHACADSGLLDARRAAWERMSEGGRAQFAWPHPGLPRLEEDEGGAAVGSAVPLDAAPLDTFCLVLLAPEEVDWLSLKSNRRMAHRKHEGGWQAEELNP